MSLDTPIFLSTGEVLTRLRKEDPDLTLRRLVHIADSLSPPVARVGRNRAWTEEDVERWRDLNTQVRTRNTPSRVTRS